MDKWRLWTSQFVHSGLFHFLGNLIELVIFGKVYEETAGMLSFALLIAASCPVANIAQSLIDPFLIVMGASGVIYSLMGACLARCVWESEPGSRRIPSATKKFVCICVILQVVCDVRIYLLQYNGNSHVSYVSHFIGLMCGICLDTYMLQRKSVFRGSVCVCLVLLLLLVWTHQTFPPPASQDSSTYSTGDYSMLSCCELQFLSRADAGMTIKMDNYSCQ